MTDDTATPKPEDIKEDEKPVIETPLDANEIHDSTFDDILNNPPKEEPKVEETPVVPAKPEEPKVEEPKTPEPVKEVTPPLDTEKLKEEISESTAKRLLEQLAPADATKDEKKDLLANAPWKKENRQPSWEEALQYMAEVNRTQVKEEILTELNQEAEKIEADEKAKTDQEVKTKEAWNSYWSQQLSDLETQGKIPPVKDQFDQNDPGRKARVDLFKKMNELALQSQAQKKPANLNLKEIYYEHYSPAQQVAATTPAKDEQPAGADAPIAGAGKSVNNGKSESFSYAEIHNKGFEDILTGN